MRFAAPFVFKRDAIRLAPFSIYHAVGNPRSASKPMPADQKALAQAASKLSAAPDKCPVFGKYEG